MLETTGHEGRGTATRPRRGAWRGVVALGVAVLVAACGADTGGTDAAAEATDETPQDAIVVPGPEGAEDTPGVSDGLADGDTVEDGDAFADGDTVTDGDPPADGDTLEGPAAPPPDDDPDLPALPGEGDPRDFHLLLVNPSDREARVFASAGAARVALDTVPAGDSTRVDIRVRADRVALEAEDDRGRGLGSVELELAPGALNRWEIGPPPGPPVARNEIRSTSVARNAIRRTSSTTF